MGDGLNKKRPSPIFIMKKILVCASLMISCATLPNGKVNWAALITDAQFGVTEACSQNWINNTACILVTDALTAASAAIATNSTMAPAIIVKILTDVELLLPADGNARPYIDWLIKLASGQ